MFYLPCFLVHSFVHDEAAVDVQDSLAHVNMLLQKDLDVISRFQQENIGRVSDKYLKKITTINKFNKHRVYRIVNKRLICLHLKDSYL